MNSDVWEHENEDEFFVWTFVDKPHKQILGPGHIHMWGGVLKFVFFYISFHILDKEMS